MMYVSYPYPIFDAPTPIRAAIFVVAGGIAGAAAVGLKRVYGWINGVDPDVSGEGAKSGVVRGTAR